MSASKKQSTREIERKFLLKRISARPEEISPRHDRAGLSGGRARRPSGASAQERLCPLAHFQARDEGRAGRAGDSAERRAIRCALAGDGGPAFDQGPLRGAVEGAHDRDRYLSRAATRGLVVAEVEFNDQKSCAAFERPDWMGRDVTGKAKYSNVALALKTTRLRYELRVAPG